MSAPGLQKTFKARVKSMLVSAAASALGRRALRPVWQGRAVIFLAHRLSASSTAPDEISLDSIAATLRELRGIGARFVRLQDLFADLRAGVDPQPGSVAFTIDDGYADQGSMAEQGFLANDCPVTIFAVSGLLDGQLWPWDDQVAYSIRRSERPRLQIASLRLDLPLQTAADRSHAVETLQNLCKQRPWPQARQLLEELWSATGVSPPRAAPPGYEPLTWDEARRLEQRGVDFAPHSVSHRITSQLEAEEARAEIDNSWSRLRAELRRPVPIYAWPTGRVGDYSLRDQQFAADAGLHGAVAVNADYADLRGARHAALGAYCLSRFPLSSHREDNLQYGTALERFKQVLRQHR